MTQIFDRREALYDPIWGGVPPAGPAQLELLPPSPAFDELENAVFAWGWARGIVQNGKPMGQAIKTMEECAELLDAVNRNDMLDIKDAVGDVMVTLIMVCATLGIEVTPCLELAYREIKDRKGFLRPDGVFVKESK